MPDLDVEDSEKFQSQDVSLCSIRGKHVCPGLELQVVYAPSLVRSPESVSREALLAQSIWQVCHQHPQ